MNPEDEFRAKLVSESTESRKKEIKNQKEKCKELIDDSNIVVVITGDSESGEMRTQILSHDVGVDELMALTGAVEELKSSLYETLYDVATGDI